MWEILGLRLNYISRLPRTIIMFDGTADEFIHSTKDINYHFVAISFCKNDGLSDNDGASGVEEDCV